ncbi:MAG: isoaspartyl peptidase/L-asparaginase family protein [candidate division WOR-3 bacterium]
MFSIVVHGGAGEWKEDMLNEAKDILVYSAEKGIEVLKDGGKPIDAVEEAIKVLEDSPIFNAGTGSVLSIDGSVEMDACIVNDNPLLMGSVIGVSNVKNPISLARIVAERTSHHIMYGKGAERLADIFQLPKADVITERSKERLERVKEKIFRGELDSYGFMEKTAELIRKYPELFIGTVGAVATDGISVCAGTSTGGTSIKLPGRVGDTPIPGAGTWAERGVGASATGIGEGIIRVLLTKRFCDFVLMGMKPEYAAKSAVSLTDYPVGIIGLDKFGNVGVYYNTPYMPAVYMVLKENKKEVKVYGIHL